MTGTHRRVSTATACGREDTRLVVIRGNSASDKSSVAQDLRDHYGRGIAIVSQDVIRRNVLREHDTARGANIALLGRIAREALNAGFHVVLEGILYADRYGHMITSLVRDHRGVTSCYYLDVPLETTFVRHPSKADVAYLAHVTDSHLASWYRELDLLPGGLETVVPADSTLQDTIARIQAETDLASASPIPPPQCKPLQGESMNPLVLMSDPRVAAIPVRECGEPLSTCVTTASASIPANSIRWARSPTSARASSPGWSTPARSCQPAPTCCSSRATGRWPYSSATSPTIGASWPPLTPAGPLSSYTTPPAGTCRHRRSRPTPQARPWT